ncbi:MAG: class I SAM-dependent methyltransferase [Gammaproteobacteria bacterium]|nr:class I SAM-dependent methyltransferase [Gammaproteobacteria bacterium]
MNLAKYKDIKGFMPEHEGKALYKWARKFSEYGPLLEIGTYCGKSSMFLSEGAQANNQYVYTIDHHMGSEEHQVNEEYFDIEIFDELSKRINSFPLFLENINNFGIKNIVPIVNESSLVAESWNSPLAMVFIDGGHSLETAMNDFISWHEKIISGGALVIHDIFENPEDGGQAPYEVYMHALKNGFNDFDRIDTIVCLKKS